jgi:hypothetical protein
MGQPPHMANYASNNMVLVKINMLVIVHLKELVGNPWLRHSSHPKRSVKFYCLHDHVITPLCKQHCEYTHRQVHLHEHPPTHL